MSAPTPPCRVGDLVQSSHWPAWPCVVLAVFYVGEPTEEERGTFEFLGYWLRVPEPHWSIIADDKRRARRSDLRYLSVRLDLDAEGRMVECLDWGQGEQELLTIVGHTEAFTPLCRAVEDTEDGWVEPEYVQQELFA